MWKRLRVLFLLMILLGVAWSARSARERARDWDGTIQISIFPLNGDGSAATAARIASLRPQDFADIEDFLAASARHYGRGGLQPVRVSLQPPANELPPAAPAASHGPSVVGWSLHMRWWAWRQPPGRPRADIRAFVVYWDSARSGGRIPNSHGLAKGQVAVAHVHAARDMQRANAVVIAHEILHTMGASDKYDPATLQPIYPVGYAEPARQPRWPQRRCELMAGRIPLEPASAAQPATLDDCLIGPASAREIGLLPH